MQSVAEQGHYTEDVCMKIEKNAVCCGLLYGELRKTKKVRNAAAGSQNKFSVYKTCA